jgi:DNA-binding response OmpR family regulator
MDLTRLHHKTHTLSVLLAEDHTPSRNEMHDILSALFAEVVSVENGEEALRIYRQYHAMHKTFDLVITDIQMPHMNGVSLAQGIKKLEKEQSIIVLSAYPENRYLLDLINIGLSRFVTKPVDQKIFLEALEEVASSIVERKHASVPKQKPALFQITRELVWDPSKRLMKYRDETVELSRNELIFIESLAKHGEQITTIQSLLEIFYCHGIDINENGIRNLVLRLRKKLPDSTIHTVYGMGYKFHT